MKTPIKYPSTSQFRQVVKNMNNVLTFDGFDGNGEIKRKQPSVWQHSFVGTVKLHGTNGSIVYYSEDDIVFQSKSRVLSLDHDNSGFMARMIHVDHKRLLDQVKYICKVNKLDFSFPVEIAGEWAGRGIQKGVAISEVDPFFAIFRVAVGNSEGSGMNWLPTLSLLGLTMPAADRIFNVLDFGYWNVTIDFSQPETSTGDLVAITQQVEEECPAGKFMGVTGVGEGVVWTPADPAFAKDSGLWFKVKGEKHSVSKVKTLAAVDPEKLSNIQEFVEYAVTENRLEQGAQEVGLDIEKMGAFLSWVNRDIIKEEGDVLASNGLIIKDVAKFVSNKSRAWYLKELDRSL